MAKKTTMTEDTTTTTVSKWLYLYIGLGLVICVAGCFAAYLALKWTLSGNFEALGILLSCFAIVAIIACIRSVFTIRRAHAEMFGKDSK